MFRRKRKGSYPVIPSEYQGSPIAFVEFYPYLDNPAGFVALGAFIASVYESRADGLDQEEIITACYAGYIGLSAYVTAGAFTGLEPTLGIKSTAK